MYSDFYYCKYCDKNYDREDEENKVPGDSEENNESGESLEEYIFFETSDD